MSRCCTTISFEVLSPGSTTADSSHQIFQQLPFGSTALQQSQQRESQQPGILLKLDKSCILHGITFKKLQKQTAGFKEFSIFGGLSPEQMVHLLSSSWRNEDEEESFSLRTSLDAHSFPSREVLIPSKFIKIVPSPCSACNLSLFASVWTIELQGIVEPASHISDTIQIYSKHLESEAIRLCLKHLRQRNLVDVFNLLQKTTGVEQLEDPLITKFHHTLVQLGDFETAEQLLEDACSKNWFDPKMNPNSWMLEKQLQSQSFEWKLLSSTQNAACPRMRGGHQMCIDQDTNEILLFGGWDGKQELADLWKYSITKQQWELLWHGADVYNPKAKEQLITGPSARSCHRVCFCPVRRRLYTLGRYVDVAKEAITGEAADYSADFWYYDLVERSWTLISRDTAKDGGPSIIYDHNICIDPNTQQIFVFGGRTPAKLQNGEQAQNVEIVSSHLTLSGFYVYDIAQNKWKATKFDRKNPASLVPLKSRMGHSIVLDPQSKEVHVFAGQRHKEYLTDFYSYNIKDESLRCVSKDVFKEQSGPQIKGHCSNIDTVRQEFYVFATVSFDSVDRSKCTISTAQQMLELQSEKLQNQVWVYNIKLNRWYKLMTLEQPSYPQSILLELARTSNQLPGTNRSTQVYPCPRYAQQVVYSESLRKFFMFGGNAGEQLPNDKRLQDFWELDLSASCKPESISFEVLRRAKYILRRQKYLELCRSESDFALPLKYLREKVSQVVNHSDSNESKDFRLLAMHLLNKPQSSLEDTSKELFKSRTQVFNKVNTFFPPSLTEPSDSILPIGDS